MPDLLANRITMSFANIVNVVPLAREGKIARAGHHLGQALGAGARPANHGGIRIPGFEAVPWFGLLAPSGTPKDVLDKLHGETSRRWRCRRCAKKFDELGLEPVGNTPAEFAAVIKKETPEWPR